MTSGVYHEGYSRPRGRGCARRVAVLACVSFALLFGSNAHAWWKFCNKTSKTVSVSIVYHDDSCWDSGYPWVIRGWWTMAQGGCKTVYGGDLQDNTGDYFYYAESSDGTLVWTSNTNTHTVPFSAFEWCWNEGHLCSGGSCGPAVNFRRKNFDGFDNFTTNLVP